MKRAAKENLNQLKALLESIDISDYTHSIEILSGSTIGQHMRHIIEFYLLLISGSFAGTISYDKRKRDIRIENSPTFALETIQRLIPGIDTIIEDEPVVLEGDYTDEGQPSQKIYSSTGRELAYCVEHSIHHQALIKTGLLAINLGDLASENFGVAYSTIRYRNS